MEESERDEKKKTTNGRQREGREKERNGRMEQRSTERAWRGTVVSLCVNVLIERDESVERETMEMQSHCTSFIQISHSDALTLSSL